MTSIPVAICRISCNKFKRHYIKEKKFSLFWIAFLICVLNVEHFEKKGEYPSVIISEISESERGGYLNV